MDESGFRSAKFERRVVSSSVVDAEFVVLEGAGNVGADLAEGILFFAEDVFEDQFCVKSDRAGSFDAETGEIQCLANRLDGWAKAILSCWEPHRKYPLAHEWQMKNRRLEPG